MTSWRDVAGSVPELAENVQRCFDAHTHKTLATLRRDGSPRISGIEVDFRDGEVWFGMMPKSVKARDVLRDNRVAIHSASPDPDERNPDGSWPGDAKLAGRAVEMTDPETFERFADKIPEGGGALFFRLDVIEVVYNQIGGDPPDHMVIESWTPDKGHEQVKRYA